MDISIVLSTFRRSQLLMDTLRSLCALRTADVSWEAVVVDNAGDSETKRVVKDFAECMPVRYLLEACGGKNRALNLAVTRASGELIVFTDDDVLADRDWLLEMSEGARRWPHHAVFGGKILPQWPNGKTMPFDHPFFLHAFCIADWNLPEGCYSAENVWGGNMAIRSAVFNRGIRFNEAIGPSGYDYVTGSETELTMRLERMGMRAIYLPRAIVHHQIRPEQIKRGWLYRRAFRQGRLMAYRHPASNATRLFGVPRWRIRQLLEAFCRYRLSVLCTDEREKFGRGLQYWRIRGIVYQYRQQYLAKSIPIRDEHARWDGEKTVQKQMNTY